MWPQEIGLILSIQINITFTAPPTQLSKLYCRLQALTIVSNDDFLKISLQGLKAHYLITINGVNTASQDIQVKTNQTTLYIHNSLSNNTPIDIKLLMYASNKSH